MKVTIIAGGRFHSFDLALQLQENQIDVHLISSYPRNKVKSFGIFPSELNSFSLLEYYLRIFKFVFGYFPPNYVISKLFDRWASNKIKYDSDYYVIWAGFGLATIKKIKESNPKAVVILERGSSHIREQKILLSKIGESRKVDNRMVEREESEYQMVDYISIPSEYSKSTFIRHGIDSKKLFINPYGVDLEGFYVSKNKKTNKTFRVGYAGMLTARKDVEGIIKAVIALNQQETKAELHLIGSVDTNSFQIKDWEDYNFIKFHKPVPQKELIHFYNSIDLFVLNSVEDGYGMVVLQALACGVPVITSDQTGGKDVVKEKYNGMVVPAGNANALAEAIDLLINDSDLYNTMKKNASISVSQGYSWEDYGKRYVHFLKELAK